MDFLKDLGLVALGYGISGISESNVVADLLDNRFGGKSLEEVVDKWAKEQNIYSRSDYMYRELLRIAEKYRL